MIIFFVALMLFFGIELLYFKIANKYNIVDKPNLRSSHTKITIRGGGVIFPIAFIAGILLFQSQNIWVALAVLAISFISFMDDLVTLNNLTRIGIHLLAVILVVYQCFINVPEIQSKISQSQTLILVGFGLVTFVLFIGIINACNFMDGINGITVLFFIATLAFLWFIQYNLGIFLLEKGVWQLLMAALLVFGYFNLRKKAKAFAGDVGSISGAVIICFLILSLIITTQNPKWILLLGIYGLDTVFTIICRLFRHENIFEAHCSHFYQYLANQRGINHILISVLYMVVQLIVNYFLWFEASGLYALVVFLFIVVVYIMARLRLESYQTLFKAQL
jgi:UDP-N-acetylmuramyl pentapeptide phosphotransferase/UDP-N-acetylglucosamine-1-phosphate transferase